MKTASLSMVWNAPCSPSVISRKSASLPTQAPNDGLIGGGLCGGGGFCACVLRQPFVRTGGRAVIDGDGVTFIRQMPSHGEIP